MDITVITALIAAIAAIISPTITALINNKYQMKVQKYICDKMQAYNEFLEAFSKLELKPAYENHSNEMCKDSAKRFLFFSS